MTGGKWRTSAASSATTGYQQRRARSGRLEAAPRPNTHGRRSGRGARPRISASRTWPRSAWITAGSDVLGDEQQPGVGLVDPLVRDMCVKKRRAGIGPRARAGSGRSRPGRCCGRRRIGARAYHAIPKPSPLAVPTPAGTAGSGRSANGPANRGHRGGGSAIPNTPASGTSAFLSTRAPFLDPVACSHARCGAREPRLWRPPARHRPKRVIGFATRLSRSGGPRAASTYGRAPPCIGQISRSRTLNRPGGAGSQLRGVARVRPPVLDGDRHASRRGRA